jgi:hypothetical protein
MEKITRTRRTNARRRTKARRTRRTITQKRRPRRKNTMRKEIITPDELFKNYVEEKEVWLSMMPYGKHKESDGNMIPGMRKMLEKNH